MSCVGGFARFWAALNEMLAGLTVRPGSGAPLSPTQAASSNTRPAHRPRSTQEARPSKLPPFFALATDDRNIRRQAFFFFLRLRRRFPKNSSTTGKASQQNSLVVEMQ